MSVVLAIPCLMIHFAFQSLSWLPHLLSLICQVNSLRMSFMVNSISVSELDEHFGKFAYLLSC